MVRLSERLDRWETEGRFNFSVFVADAAVAAWLMLALHAFGGLSTSAPVSLLILALVAALSGWLWQLHAFAAGSPLRVVRGWGGHLATLVVIVHFFPQTTGVRLETGMILWLVCAQFLLSGIARLIYRRIAAASGPAPLEGCRWAAIGAASILFWQIFYMPNPIGAGDAYWYVLMLSDYLTQLRAGIFPVWIGQTEFAFNGAVSPLRLAPGFQHAGGLLDLATGQTLEFVALKNALLVVTSLAVVFSTYFCLRSMLPRRPNTAAVLAVLYLLSPGVLAPLCISDQYMSFLAVPLVPWALYGMWRAYTRNDRTASVVLGAAVGGLWLFHPPIAMWTSLLCATMYAGKLAVHRRSGCETRRTLLAGAVYVLLGTYPIVSTLTLDNVLVSSVPGENPFREIQRAFPGCFLPLDLTANAHSNYQTGYSVLAVGLAALALLFRRRTPVCAAFLSAAGLLLLLIVPVPGLCLWLWTHLPGILLRATNDWPMQRFYLILAALLVFAFAAALSGLEQAGASRNKRSGDWALLLAFLLMLGWSGREARILFDNAAKSITRGSDWRYLYAHHNLILTRYPYTSFEWAPSYFSHGYMDPALENRLLRRADQSILLANAEVAAAAPPAGRAARLIYSGRVHANLIPNSAFYRFDVRLRIETRRHYALRVKALKPAVPGWLQVMGDQLFREYIVPDSGRGFRAATLPPRAFGSMPTSSPIISLYTDAPGGTDLKINYILPELAPALDFDAADLELWEYDPTTLPVKVHTFTPYRARVESPEPAYLESPRMWLGGYRGRVNGDRVPVLRSNQNLAMIAVPAGVTEVEIKFMPSLVLEIWYWATLGGWLVLAAVAVFRLVRRPAITSPAAGG